MMKCNGKLSVNCFKTSDSASSVGRLPEDGKQDFSTMAESLGRVFLAMQDGEFCSQQDRLERHETRCLAGVSHVRILCEKLGSKPTGTGVRIGAEGEFRLKRIDEISCLNRDDKGHQETDRSRLHPHRILGQDTGLALTFSHPRKTIPLKGNAP